MQLEHVWAISHINFTNRTIENMTIIIWQYWKNPAMAHLWHKVASYNKFIGGREGHKRWAIGRWGAWEGWMPRLWKDPEMILVAKGQPYLSFPHAQASKLARLTTTTNSDLVTLRVDDQEATDRVDMGSHGGTYPPKKRKTAEVAAISERTSGTVTARLYHIRYYKPSMFRRLIALNSNQTLRLHAA